MEQHDHKWVKVDRWTNECSVCGGRVTGLYVYAPVPPVKSHTEPYTKPEGAK